MHYIILIYGDEKSFAMMANDPKAQEQMYAAYTRYGGDMQAAGVLRGGAELKPTHSATTVRVRNGKTRDHRRPVRRDQGAARRLLPDRRAQSRRRGALGGALPVGDGRLDRGSPARPLGAERPVSLSTTAARRATRPARSTRGPS